MTTVSLRLSVWSMQVDVTSAAHCPMTAAFSSPILAMLGEGA
jgi:hypothetical protein